MKRKLLTFVSCFFGLLALSGFHAGENYSLAKNNASFSYNHFFSLGKFECSTPVTDTALKVIHLYVSLCDNDSQGVIPVPRKLGNGNEPSTNQFWGAPFGVKTFFQRCDDWEMIDSTKNISYEVMQRCVFKSRKNNTYLVADAYRGSKIKTCTMNFLLNVSGHPCDSAKFSRNGKSICLLLEHSNLVCYLGHDGFMDFEIPNPPPQNSAERKEVMIFAPASKLYFKDPILVAGGIPTLWTTNLLSLDAYSLKAALDGWMLHESGGEICLRAARAYDSFQKCGFINAQNIFASGYY